MSKNESAVSEMIKKTITLLDHQMYNSDRVQVNARLDPSIIWALDKVADVIKQSRTATATDILTAGVQDAVAEAFSLSTEEDFIAFWRPYYEANPAARNSILYLGEERWKELNGVKE